MAIIIPSEVLSALGEVGAQLLEEASQVAPGFTYVAQDATDQERDQAIMVQTLVLSVQALLSRAPFNELGVVTAMASVSGMVMANCASDRRELYRVFQAQMASTLKDIGELTTPQGNA